MNPPLSPRHGPEMRAAAMPPPRIGEARPFLLLLVTLAALGLVNRGLRDDGVLPAIPMVWWLYASTWILLALCTLAALTHHRRTMWREERLLSLLLAISLAVDLVEVNVRLIQGQVPGRILLLQAALLYVVLVALFTYLYWRLERTARQPEQRAFWWVPPPSQQFHQQKQDVAASVSWQPGFLDYLYLACTISFSFFPHVDPIRPVARLLVIAQLIVVFDVDLILLARAVSLIPT
jgi:Ca2+/Na+ antiporter